MALLRHSLDKNDGDLHDMFTNLLQGIHHVAGDQPNSEMKSKIENWINKVFMDVNEIEENIKTDYFTNILLFAVLLSATNFGENGENNEMNVSSLDWTCNRFLSLTHVFEDTFKVKNLSYHSCSFCSTNPGISFSIS